MIVLKGDRPVKSGEQPAHDSEIERLTAEWSGLKSESPNPRSAFVPSSHGLLI